MHIATKVRYPEDRLDDILGYTRESVAASLGRLGTRRVTLLQRHNSVTARCGDEPTSLTLEDVLGTGGVLDAFRELQDEGVVGYLGLTGIGQPAVMREVVNSGAFDTMQVPFNALNPSAGSPMPAGFAETDYGNIIADCGIQGMGGFAIRVFAGGALRGFPRYVRHHRLSERHPARRGGRHPPRAGTAGRADRRGPERRRPPGRRHDLNHAGPGSVPSAGGGSVGRPGP